MVSYCLMLTKFVWTDEKDFELDSTDGCTWLWSWLMPLSCTLKMVTIAINGWMDKEVVVYLCNGILLSHKKGWTWAICSDVARSRICHIEWSTSEKEKQVSFINTYM